MYSLRIHSVGPPSPPQPSESTPSTSTSTTTTPNPNPDLQILEIKGTVHLYRRHPPTSSSPSTSSSSDPLPLLPTSRTKLLFALAVPCNLTVEDFLRFCGPHHVGRFSEVRIVRNDGVEDRYSVLIMFHDQGRADSFYLHVNGWEFPSQQGEICHILFLSSVEYTESLEIATTPPAGSTELPTCPICIERLDQDTSGIATSGCDHSVQCSCIPKSPKLSCMVCQFCLDHSDKPTCSVCGTSENLWICIICSFVGCGRYKEGHAIRHWKQTQHCYSLDMGTQRVWDYVGDTYVHRLNLSKSDGKIIKSKRGCRPGDGPCGTCEFGEDSGFHRALLSSQMEAIVDEYNMLLATELEKQRQYYESLIVEARAEQEKLISEALENASCVKLQNAQLDLEKTIEEKKKIAAMNEKLAKEQEVWQEKIKESEKSGRSILQEKYQRIRDLADETRDFTVYLEAQKVLSNAADSEDIKEGTILPIQPQQSSSNGSRKPSKANRHRR